MTESTSTTTRAARRAWLVLLLGAFAASALAGVARTNLIDRDGNLYALRAGTYGELASGETLAASEVPVLALDVLASDGSLRRAIVPSSLAPGADEEGRIFLESATGTLLVLWVAHDDAGDEVRLASYRGGHWIEDRAVSASSSARRQGLDTLMTPFLAAGAVGADEIAPRHVLSALWWESPGGARYAPIFLDHDGDVLAQSLAVYEPAALVPAAAGDGCAEERPDAALHPTIARESPSTFHLSIYDPVGCRFLIVPIQRFDSHSESDEEGGLLMTVFAPFIGVAVEITANAALTRTDDGGALLDPRFDTAASPASDGYPAALSGVCQSEEASSEAGGSRQLVYRLYDPSSASWSSARRISIGNDVSVSDARAILLQLLEAR